ncbi:hypothetical protein BGX26_006703, partial [Mortierella sp. AD094]
PQSIPHSTISTSSSSLAHTVSSTASSLSSAHTVSSSASSLSSVNTVFSSTRATKVTKKKSPSLKEPWQTLQDCAQKVVRFIMTI